MKSHQHANRFDDRRNLLKTAAGIAGVAGVSSMMGPAVGDESASQQKIEGYANRLSCLPGDEIGLCISTNANRYNVEVARVGAKREVVYKQADLPGVSHDVPIDASSQGCRWPVVFNIPVGKEWRSGYYQVILRTEDGAGRGEAFFIVRSSRPGGDANILLQLCTNTYNAYNQWGGSSLYGGPAGFAPRVSFERPYMGFLPEENFTNLYSGWRRWELPFVQWAERAGYQLDYAINLDLEFCPEVLPEYRLVLSVGHDEYWSAGMRDNLEKFISDGGNVAFFSGNVAFWQVRVEDGGRAMVSWKSQFQNDPVYKTNDRRFLTGTWSNRLIKRPENQLTGVSFTYGGYHAFGEQPGDGNYIIHRPDHWMFAGTGLKRGDRLGGHDKIVGYECDGCLFKDEGGLPVPTGEDGTPEQFQILGSAPAYLAFEIDHVSEGVYGVGTTERIPQPGAAILGCYTHGGTVVTTGCTEWVRGLQKHNPHVEQITRNIFDRLSSRV